jgi:hypothetical protein
VSESFQAKAQAASMLTQAIESRLSKLIHKLSFYGVNALRALIPATICERQRKAILGRLQRLPPEERAAIERRVAYYNRLQSSFSVSGSDERIGDFTSKGKSSAYCADFKYFIRFFSSQLQVSYLFGDITQVPGSPRFLKSRPITRDYSNANSVLLKLNAVRHYYFVRDRKSFAEKKPQAVWRGKSNRPHRIEFARQYADHPLCNIGCVLHKEKQPESYHREFLSVEEQLQYQFIVSVEGIDVATNLKWIMGSNSLCLMRRPRFETWFMEGMLIPGHHYILLKDGYSDLVEKVSYYREYHREAQAIITNANRHVAQFTNANRERLIALLVIEKYMGLSGQTQQLQYESARAVA